MENLWNQRDLKPPPVYTLKCQKTISKIGDLKLICKDLEETLKKNEVFHTEAALLSRMIYRTRNKFRCDKGFQNIRKVKKCLQRYLEMEAHRLVLGFSSCLPDQLTGSLYVPSRQMLQCVLVRLMGLARLLHQAVLFCKAAARFTLHRIRLGHSWSLATLLLAITSRVWSLCERLVWSVCQAYQGLLVFVPQLPASDVAWLPPLFSFPPNLALWLGAEKPGRHSAEGTQLTRNVVSDKIFGLVGDEEEEEVVFESSTVVTADAQACSTFSAPAHVPVLLTATGRFSNNQEDLGESIASLIEENSKTLHHFSALQKKIGVVRNLEDLTSFISKDLSKNDQNHVYLRKQLKGVVKSLKKSEKLSNDKRTAFLIQKAKDTVITNIT